MSKGRTRIVVGIIVVVALVLLAMRPATLMESTHLGPGGNSELLRLGAYEGDVGALEWIALEKGFFAKVGLSVDMKGYSSGKEAMDALAAGLVDVATASDFVVAAGGFADPKLRVLASISCYRNKGIVGRRDRGIANPADLKGKRIGLTSPSAAEYSLYVLLALNGLGDKDVTAVNLLPQDLVGAMTQGSIDAAITWQPHVQALQAVLGADGVTFEGSVFDVYLLLVTREDALAARSKGMTKLLRALALAEEWALSNPEQTKALIARRFNLNASAVETQWLRMRLALTLPQELLVAMDGQARWLAKKESKSATTIPNYAAFIAAQALRDVNPSAVTLLTDTGATPGIRVPTANNAQ